MKDIKLLTTHEQLKALSDPFKCELLLRLMEKPQTGQQLSEVFELSRARIHYHLKELEKNDLVTIVRKEEKNGIVQKFYQATAGGFVPDRSLLPYSSMTETVRQMMISMLDQSKRRILAAPEESLQDESGSKDPSEWKFRSSAYEIHAKEEDFMAWQKKFSALMEELASIQRPKPTADAKLYYFHILGLEIEEGSFEKKEKES
ncbi:winged helix-turn-helix domain-containing protein [Virgibacillus halodenitrificans]|uniref:winged helix-turn-helix domain-containing protein n=1 Tax=Virgibacillus halodenitrificans TaxID=1482 RepID=UPI001FB34D99|nr:winged helix-turn-helix domain-containing protein [Virgibacillus halodenitrificans]MCJ0930502.1 winged helix-turn-helix domain-containing protein [Virgibacillus halodenitrificans]